MLGRNLEKGYLVTADNLLILSHNFPMMPHALSIYHVLLLVVTIFVSHSHPTSYSRGSWLRKSKIEVAYNSSTSKWAIQSIALLPTDFICRVRYIFFFVRWTICNLFFMWIICLITLYMFNYTILVSYLTICRTLDFLLCIFPMVNKKGTYSCGT